MTHVYHPECPLKVDEELTKDALVRAHRRFTGFDAQKLRHRVTRVHHPDCTLKPGDLLTESEGKQLRESYLGFTTSHRKTETGSFRVERLYRIAAVNHPDCPLEVDELLTSANRPQSAGSTKGWKSLAIMK